MFDRFDYDLLMSKELDNEVQDTLAIPIAAMTLRRAEERRLNGLQVAASIAGDPGCERRLAAVLDLPDAAVAALLACAQHQALAETETFELQAEYDERGQERVFALVLDGALALRVQPAPLFTFNNRLCIVPKLKN